MGLGIDRLIKDGTDKAKGELKYWTLDGFSFSSGYVISSMEVINYVLNRTLYLTIQ